MENTIVEIVTKQFTPFLIFIFGSMVKGNTRKDSDIDIAFIADTGGGKIDQYELFTTAQEIAAKLNRDVDLIDLSQSSTVFQAQIVHTGKAIYCTDLQKKAQYEMKILKMYAKLNEERSPILLKIDESGTIYEK
ncbi:nucleotidyltransferase domain-containing protein [Bacillaceae bacterium Marseille-Q3522]|nr:nucleotidyltransferase domain-containing protein [Bacillaceae bacterium Marseille-Q3522]